MECCWPENPLSRMSRHNHWSDHTQILKLSLDDQNQSLQMLQTKMTSYGRRPQNMKKGIYQSDQDKIFSFLRTRPRVQLFSAKMQDFQASQVKFYLINLNLLNRIKDTNLSMRGLLYKNLVIESEQYLIHKSSLTWQFLSLQTDLITCSIWNVWGINGFVPQCNHFSIHIIHPSNCLLLLLNICIYSRVNTNLS